MEPAEKAKEAEWNEGGRERRHEAIDLANEGWPACHNGRGFYGMGGPEHVAELLEAFSKQMFEVAVLVGGVGVSPAQPTPRASLGRKYLSSTIPPS
jgi:hypothetical protein